MSKLIFVIGAGGHAKVLIDNLHANKIQIKNILDKKLINVTVTNILNEIVVSEQILHQYSPDEVLLVNGVGSTSQPHKRQEIFERYKKNGFSFLSVIHPTAYVAADVEYGEGCQIMAGCIIQPGCRLGDNVVINTKASIDHDCCIGDHVHLAPGVTLSGNVVIGKNTHVGTGATIIQNIYVGSDSLIAAGAVVITSIAKNITVAGVPARELSND